MFAFLCKPVPVHVRPDVTQVVAKDCRMVEIQPSRYEKDSFEMKILAAPPVTLSTKNFQLERYKKLSRHLRNSHGQGDKKGQRDQVSTR